MFPAETRDRIPNFWGCNLFSEYSRSIGMSPQKGPVSPEKKRGLLGPWQYLAREH